MGQTPVKKPFVITQDDGNITEADGTVDTWSDIWKYQAPQGTGIILETGNTFSVYLEDASAEVGNDTCYVKIEHRDPSGQDRKNVWGESLYYRAKEFQEISKLAVIRLNEPFKVYPREWIVIMVKDDGTIDASDSYFELRTSKVALPL
jgi:hypothetical protein